MDIATFSDSDLTPYSIDGLFLSALRQNLAEAVEGIVDPETFSTETTIVFKPDRVSEIERRDETGQILTDGSIPDPLEVRIVARGIMRGSTWMDSLHASLKLSAEGSDHLYVKGPEPDARRIYEGLSRAIASRAMPPIEQARTTSRRILSLSSLRWVVGIAGACSYVVGLASHHHPLDMILVLGGMFAIALCFVSVYAGTLFRRPRKTEAPARRIVNIISLARPEGGSGPMLEHQPGVPINLS